MCSRQKEQHPGKPRAKSEQGVSAEPKKVYTPGWQRPRGNWTEEARVTVRGQSLEGTKQRPFRGV